MGARGGSTKRGERGAAIVEYVVILALIAVLVVLAVANLGLGTADAFGRVADGIPGALNAGDAGQASDDRDCSGPNGVARRVGWDHSNGSGHACPD